MHINRTILSIPPYLSVSWKEVSALRVNEGLLAVVLKDGTQLSVPDLTEDQLQMVFDAHQQYLETEDQAPSPILPPNFEQLQGMMGDQVVGLPFRFGPGGMGGMDGISSVMQHDPSQSNAPNIPDEILSKISGITEVLGAENVTSLPQAEEGCNCFHCQIARAINPSETEEHLEEEVTDEELTFRTWDIEQADEKLYTVSNPLDKTEKYSVFLGEPIGCTCGQKNCEHIKAVLQT